MLANIEAIKELRDKTGIGLTKCKNAIVKSNGSVEKAIELLRKEGVITALKKSDRAAKEAVLVSSETDAHIGILEAISETDFVSGNVQFAEGIREILQIIMSKNSSDLNDKDIEEKRLDLVQMFGENVVLGRLITIEKKSGCSYSSYVHLRGRIGVIVELEGSSSLKDIAKDLCLQITVDNPEFISIGDVPSEVKARELDIAKVQLGDKVKDERILTNVLEGKFKKFCEENCLLERKFIRDDTLTVKDVLKNIDDNIKVSIFHRMVAGEKH
ncbi:MAG: translation elongation factor Ts [Chlamydiia bacterium]|nr:translation elongation factor Ts [Chlamydiia bacterium]